jgi:hypothetical protein
MLRLINSISLLIGGSGLNLTNDDDCLVYMFNKCDGATIYIMSLQNHYTYMYRSNTPNNVRNLQLGILCYPFLCKQEKLLTDIWATIWNTILVMTNYLEFVLLEPNACTYSLQIRKLIVPYMYMLFIKFILFCKISCRPLPEELVKYAQGDTHYLLYIYDKLRQELIDRGNDQNNLLLSVLQRSKDICTKVMWK